MENWIANDSTGPRYDAWVMVRHKSGWECEGFAHDFIWSKSVKDPILDYQILPEPGEYRQTFVVSK